MHLFLDTETIPNLSADQIAEIATGITAPGNYKNPEAIAKWEAENKQRLVDEAVHKSCFDGSTGRIICLSWAWDNDDPVVEYGDCESELLETFFSDVFDTTQQQLSVIGHNVSWDVRYIWQRAVVHRIKPPSNIKWQGKPWDYQDTMMMWNPDSQRKISLDKLCTALSVKTSKDGMDGSNVWQAYKDGKIAEIAKYCADDVRAVRDCYRRMTFAS